MRLSSRLLVTSATILLILSGAAVADSCTNWVYTCAKHSNDVARLGGGVASGQSVGILLNSNMFNTFTANGNAGSDVIILAAFANGTPQGTLNGFSFTSLTGDFPEKGATGAITDSLQGLGFCGSTCNLSFAYVNLGTALAANGSLSITAKGVLPGTVFYAEVLNSQGQIVYITPNSEAGILGHGTSPVPEPGSLSLLITGLCGIAGGAWRKLRG
jgi:hypothetical protein